MKTLITAFKYQGKSYLGEDIANIILSYNKMVLTQYSFDLVLHVPLHISKVIKRGFDQSYILSEFIGRGIGVLSHFGNLERDRKTETQTYFNKKDRKRNVKGAFILNKPERLKGKRILLVDDVFTTGATVNECSRIIKKSGAEKVIVVTAARA